MKCLVKTIPSGGQNVPIFSLRVFTFFRSLWRSVIEMLVVLHRLISSSSMVAASITVLHCLRLLGFTTMATFTSYTESDRERSETILYMPLNSVNTQVMIFFLVSSNSPCRPGEGARG